jgi:O-methyltransferase
MPIKTQIANAIRSALGNRGIVVQREFGPDVPQRTIDTIKAVRPFTMTTAARVEAVVSATEYLIRYEIPGAFVESGVWKGGSSMAAAYTLAKLDVDDRDFFMYDTYEGIPAPGAEDALIGGDHESLKAWWDEENKDPDAAPWLDAPVETVRANMALTGYDIDRVHLIPGLVEETIPATAPEQVAFLRLDTDYYSSTKVELEHLFPRLSPGGVLIVDDYGYTEGARKAVDEYFAGYPDPIFLNRIDAAGRLVVKPRG